ncbi:undecaprenyldiphospho-muramoylpentapeptide beta-N-acetylglucosaminyltransferase [Candidatus Palibaumannia cicadellinicola]|uniref:UDP-N-acetylglucosamine--N-acetylmuramyl-(pentapeptide) pyrophosphoryl-undecaprenol N-acetylglucosamine transferase n=1 Tax=Baumannia cicadellinicola subsp. Homalodisca coagulata TaxID=374463 RepID=MURG_BAUCH|nr:undecaprenyldiphospho-muramoylpentapeptide beta-N-acetylglucosaminyltransferase [Candidatus Baumannia cicadellinicola]Q1LSW5.1 RecName: Full=UDP-N-acetylglucosamine--N-acetylmuramyl-(pentapeptide) pyrophosphoryl-undecaprenol N-acetylglucosamine transferase; AltName: Full=Undecaprenyl-PP-MurNAc-pentapeptide-UDPGlcNAc GlcNAc transferase [Baumannia cicadellinicola str. Hc (Homalodisca coagulata)]ABF13989.1 UDP-N-acetylglucosamine--N-acetylmuramyl-(pentapeptide) pyrophosphoryl-undecaprenol N-acety
MIRKRLIIVAGGTGGHIFPGLAIANNMITQGWDVRWLGTKNRIEADLVPKHGITTYFLSIYGYGLHGKKQKILAIVSILQAVLQSYYIMRKWRPDIVLGMGGYISGPCGLAAWMCKIPLVIHEQNRVTGLTNYYLSKFAKKVLQAFPSVFPNANVVGNPIRKEILAVIEPSLRLCNRTGPIRILVIGGSQGSKIINQILPVVAAQLAGKYVFWHQVGKGALKEVQQVYTSMLKNQLNYKLVEFIDDIAIAYAWADVVICRSGALTISEIAAVGLPAIFVPFMHKDRHQYWNALPLEQLGAAKILEQPNFTAEKVSQILMSWDRSKLFTMAQRARTIAMVDSTERVTSELIELANNTKH